MKRHIFILFYSFLLLPELLLAQGQLKYYNADTLQLLGKLSEKSKPHYGRFPDSLKTRLRDRIWYLSTNSAGLAIRFRSNTSTVGVKWESLYNNYMNHMTPTGIKGLDLYTWIDKKWRFVNSARPTAKVGKVTVISNMLSKDREYLLYLPLYDGITKLEIGVDSLASFSQPLINIPVREKPIVFYGTSILQGGCASRPGMAYTNIISRRLNREIINLGFSGNAFLDYEIAHMMAEIDVEGYVLDFVPNASVKQINEKMETFYKILRSKHASVPIFFIEDPIFTHSLFDCKMAEEIKDKNAALNKIFLDLKKKGDKKIYIISSKSMLGGDGEATVDGIHFTDLGMVRYANLICPLIKKYFK